MSHSRANNESADLEHLELTEELLGSTTDDSQIEPPSPPPHRDSRRVSINSQASTSSTGTVKPSYHHPHILSEPSPRGASTRMSTTGSSSSAIRPKPSFRHSSAHLGDAGNGGGGRRRRQGGGRPASTRSSIRRRNRSSDVDEDEEDEAYDGHPAFLEEHSSDVRSNHSHLRRGSSRRSVRLEDHDARSFDGHDRHDDDEGSEAEPLTLKDRQEVSTCFSPHVDNDLVLFFVCCGAISHSLPFPPFSPLNTRETRCCGHVWMTKIHARVDHDP